MIDDVTATDVTVYEGEASPSLVNFPPALRGLFNTDHLTDLELLNFQIMASEYTGGETVNAKRFYSRTIVTDGERLDKIVWLWGLFMYPKNRVDEMTGEAKRNVGVVFQVGDREGPTGVYLSFESISATRFVERSLLPLINRGLIGIGDWSIGLPMQVWEVPLDRGHTFRFKLVKPTEVTA